MRAAALLLMLLAGCGEGADAGGPPAPPGPGAMLERAAIDAGVISDPASLDATGLYARDTDRLCLVPDDDRYRAGAFVDYGQGQGCAASGSARRDGDRLRFDFGEGCAIVATFEGDRIVFPAAVASACDRLCTRRASLSALAVERLSDAASEASTLRSPRGRLLCAAAQG